MTPHAPLSIDPIPAGGRTPGDWIAMHIYYTGSPNPLLADCVAPLVAALRERDLISRYFYIRYWLEGPHTRLRLKPARPQDEPAVRQRAEAAVDGFLARRPAVYEVDLELRSDMYKQMFLSEYSQEQWNERYGEDGQMRVHPNNSYDYIEYTPEHERYGGRVGIDMAEWHFEKSSDIALQLAGTTNVHVRSVLFGSAIQMMAVMCMTFLPDAPRAADFLLGYRNYWESSYPTVRQRGRRLYDKAYRPMASSLGARVRYLHAAVVRQDFGQLTGFVQDWAVHCYELRNRILDLISRRELTFPARENSAEWEAATDQDLAFRVLLSSYVHMNDNRLGVTIHDEIYLAYVLRQAILDFIVEAGEHEAGGQKFAASAGR
jgi:hypothetical protein